MKKIITPLVLEEVKYFCDKHPSRECYSSIKTRSWYGSGWDMMGIDGNLCDECLKKLYEILEQQFRMKPVDKELL